MNIFEYTDYKKWVKDRVSTLTKKGHGQYRKMAEFLSVNTVNISQTFNGSRHLTPELAVELSEFFGLNELEAEYLLNLVERDRSGTHKHKLKIQKRIDQIKKQSKEVKNLVPVEAELSDEAKSTFYSQWYYIGILLFTGLKKEIRIDDICEHFQISKSLAQNILQFLESEQLCKQENGVYRPSVRKTHLSSEHPLVHRHHSNWRIKSLDLMSAKNPTDLFVTIPCSLDDIAKEKIRTELLESISRISKLISPAPEEKLVCLAIDFFSF